jgi:hypothetical protein
MGCAPTLADFTAADVLVSVEREGDALVAATVLEEAE